MFDERDKNYVCCVVDFEIQCFSVKCSLHILTAHLFLDTWEVQAGLYVYGLIW